MKVTEVASMSRAKAVPGVRSTLARGGPTPCPPALDDPGGARRADFPKMDYAPAKPPSPRRR
ncbi:MAG TPA: hypothetical protein VMQ62_04590 [Dongiaceae bacterium]|nr:hypothetical protein [Dongiaceae bacterium]